MTHSSPSRLGLGLQAGQVAAGAGLAEQLAGDDVGAVHLGRGTLCLAESLPWARIVGATIPRPIVNAALVGHLVLRLERVVRLLVGARADSCRRTRRPADPPEACVELLAAPSQARCRSLVSSVRLCSSNIATLSEPSPHTNLRSASFLLALASRKSRASVSNSWSVIEPISDFMSAVMPAR